MNFIQIAFEIQFVDKLLLITAVPMLWRHSVWGWGKCLLLGLAINSLTLAVCRIRLY
jgi:hypothetical protein